MNKAEIIPKIISRDEIHNFKIYNLDYLNKIPIVKEVFEQWIENDDIIPLIIQPLWNYMNNKDNQVTIFKEIIERIGMDNFKKVF